MTDPERTYRSLVSGDPAALAGHVRTLSAMSSRLDRARTDVDTAAGVPVWTGGAANAYAARASSLTYGISVNREVTGRLHGALDVAEAAYRAMESSADAVIAGWRGRDQPLPPLVEEIFARVFNGALVGLGRAYDRQLTAIRAVLSGEEVDTDDLDEQTREWVERGQERTDDWLDETGGGLGPLIPNTAATGDGRGLIPQGLGYDPLTRSLLQAYYKDGEPSVLAVVDEVTGKELTEVELGGYGYDDTRPGHVGGVTVDGDSVYVTDSGKVYEYSLREIRAAGPGTTVEQVQRPTDVAASSYSAFRDGRLYVGDHDASVMYVYEKDAHGVWVPVRDSDGGALSIATPDKAQGVLVRDGEFVFSTSHGRQNESALVVQDRDSGERSDEYPLPNMSQGVVEVDGQLYVTYESGAEKFDDAGTGGAGWLWGVPDDDGLWAMRNLTTTPLSALGLEPEVEVEPATLRSASGDMEDAAFALGRQSSVAAGLTVTAADFGDFPAAAPLATVVDDSVGAISRSLEVGSRAVRELAESLWSSGHDYDRTDQQVQAAFHQLRD